MVKMFGRSYSEATSLVLYYVDDEFRKTYPDLPTIMGNKPKIWLKTVAIAKESGLLYYFSKRLFEEGMLSKSSLEYMVKEEEKGFKKLRNTLLFIKSVFESEGLDFRIIKFYRNIPYVPRDVDILIRKDQTDQVFAVLGKKGVIRSFSNGVETQFRKKDLFKIDLYQGFHYLSLNFFDDEFLWKNPRIVNICCIECPIPSYEADFLSTVIHSFLGHGYLSLLDFIYIKDLMNKIYNFNEILYQVRKYNWSYAFLSMISTIIQFYQEIYLKSNIIDFPYVFSPKFILKTFNGFANMPINAKSKFAFILSSLINYLFHEYQKSQRFIPIEIPKDIKDPIMKCIWKVRSLSGDYSLSD
jgi:hypothetical protein